mmetsp:Transcript_40015/g.127313  ORF Transcript_40015/g.127313 Transcript_40015/m.127313 type:complete len:254 (+) Transcript_40015:55-816(+)
MGGNQSAQPQGQPANASGAGNDAGASASTGGNAASSLMSSRPAPKNKVELAVSPLGGIPGATAYHSSVVVNGEEFFFSDAGITSAQNLASHRNPQMPDNVPQVFDMGMSHYSGTQLKAALEKHFLPGTYDLLKKNCNSFSDCSLFYLLHRRLEKKYRSLEQLGASAAGLIQTASGGQYSPNPKAADFDLEKLVADIDPDKVWSTPGQATGGTTAGSAEAMRAARLARFSSGGGAAAGASSAGGACAANTDMPS